MASLLDPPPRPGAAAALHALLGGVERVDALLTGEPAATPPDPGGALGWLARAYELSDFDVDIVVLALAPELDRRYAAEYARLQGDPAAQAPSVELALRLLCGDPFQRAVRRGRFAAGAPLARVLRPPLGPPEHPAAPLLVRPLVLEPQVVALLLDDPGLDPRIAHACVIEAPPDRDPGGDAGAVTAQALARDGRACLLVTGPGSAARRRTAESAAARIARPLLRVDAARLGGGAERVALAAREARFRDVVLALDEAQALWPHSADGALDDPPPVTVVAATAAPAGGDWDRVLSAARRLDAPLPGAGERRAAWRSRLTAAGVEVADDVVDDAASRFRLDADEIAGAVAALPVQADREALFAAARARAGHVLSRLAHKVELVHRFEDLVLPPDRLEQLEELCVHVAQRARVYEDWGFGARHGHASGVAVLFSGPPGTGKTMAASVIAGRLGLDLYRIDLAGVVSKYIGETEQNLDRIFAAAEHSNAILFFDEADALFGRRTETRDAHDRYANLEVSFLLQRIELYSGVAILASNLRRNMDDAFTRRMRFAIEFPLPGEAERRRIWELVWPAELPRDSGVDAGALATRFELAGGGIRNVAVASAFLAAADGGRVTLEHILRATRREYEKTRRIVHDDDFVLQGPR